MCGSLMFQKLKCLVALRRALLHPQLGVEPGASLLCLGQLECFGENKIWLESEGEKKILNLKSTQNGMKHPVR